MHPARKLPVLSTYRNFSSPLTKNSQLYLYEKNPPPDPKKSKKWDLAEEKVLPGYNLTVKTAFFSQKHNKFGIRQRKKFHWDTNENLLSIWLQQDLGKSSSVLLHMILHDTKAAYSAISTSSTATRYVSAIYHPPSACLNVNPYRARASPYAEDMYNRQITR